MRAKIKPLSTRVESGVLCEIFGISEGLDGFRQDFPKDAR
jgi:hypothetical protein